MNKRLKVGVFGASRGFTMIEVLMNHPDAELVAVCDKHKPLLEKCQDKADELGISLSLFEDFEDFFLCDMDAVVLANYATEHAPFAIRLLNSGRHVMSEVLPVETLSQAVELVEAVENSGKVYAYAENYLYFPSTFEMKLRFQKGEIGEFMHGEGEYIHDCSSIWPNITYGEKNHWRNLIYSTFYCTHSLGPIINITGAKPKKIVGFESFPPEYLAKYGNRAGASGLIIIQMDNGATIKSINGNLKREPSSIWYSVYGTKGMMESDRWDTAKLSVYVEGDKSCEGDIEHYYPEQYKSDEYNMAVTTHGGSDFYATHFFLQKILGREDGKYSIDVYQALDMGLPGILAYRSILLGNQPVDYIDFRNKNIRDQYRNDVACSTESVAGDQLLPCNSFGDKKIDDAVYDKVKEMWLNHIPG